MNKELKPCPFCGGKAELVNYGLTGRLKIVQCLDCGARTRAFDTEVKRGESACDAWNKRKKPKTAIDVHNKLIGSDSFRY